MAKKRPDLGQRTFQSLAHAPKIPDGYYSGDKPNPNLRRFVEQNATPYDPETDDYDVPAFNRPIETTKATAIYNMHVYWSKKPHTAIRQYIQHYTQPGDIVLDPFCGSGGTALAALLDGRKAVTIDRSPAATFITKNHCTPVDTDRLRLAFQKVRKEVQPEIDWLYETRCDRCGGKATTGYTVYSQVFQCPRCLAKIPLSDCAEDEAETSTGKTKSVNICPGKTYLYRNISYYSHVLSGGKATPAGLFINNATGKVGVVGTRDAVVFDEIANTDFTDPKAPVSIMQGYMQDGKFSRGKKEILAFASIVLVGNLEVQGRLPHEKYYHLFEPLPAFLQVEAFIDRLHAYVPGWEIPKIGPDSVSQDYGLITDYFCEIMHELRRIEVLGRLRSRFQLVDTSSTGSGVTGRDIRAVEKVLSGLVKLLYPHGELDDDELAELLALAVEVRQRVRNQLHLMAPGEFGPTVLGARVARSGQTIVPKLRDAQREQHVTLPNSPRVGEVIGLGVLGEDRGIILHFEMQASSGSGRIIPLGSMQKVMKESVSAAGQYIKVNAKALGLPANWSEEKDVAVLATMMAMPKEGPSAGITIVTGIVSALTGRPVRNDLAMTGEITIMGKVLGVGGILAKLQAAIDAGCREVVVPRENERDVTMIPDYLRGKIQVRHVATIEEVLEIALLRAK
jgi:hypothetical protein